MFKAKAAKKDGSKVCDRVVLGAAGEACVGVRLRLCLQVWDTCMCLYVCMCVRVRVRVGVGVSACVHVRAYLCALARISVRTNKAKVAAKKDGSKVRTLRSLTVLHMGAGGGKWCAWHLACMYAVYHVFPCCAGMHVGMCAFACMCTYMCLRGGCVCVCACVRVCVCVCVCVCVRGRGRGRGRACAQTCACLSVRVHVCVCAHCVPLVCLLRPSVRECVRMCVCGLLCVRVSVHACVQLRARVFHCACIHMRLPVAAHVLMRL
jgi:hypothetical protein